MSERWVAAIDCGTNAVRMLVSRLGPAGVPVEVTRELELTRLGERVDETGQFQPAALARTFAAVDRYAAIIAAHPQIDRVRFVATSAARDVTNRAEFFAGVRARLGVDPEVIAGTEEAELSFTGALAAHNAPEPVLVVDVGGGSTELVLGRRGGIINAVSLDVGCVRLRERFMPSEPPTQDEVAAARTFTRGLLAGFGVDFAAVRGWIGVGGTATTLAAIEQRLPRYVREFVDGSTLSVGALETLTDELCRLPATAIRGLADVHPTRADVIGTGALISSEIAARVGLDMLVSEADILDGIVMRLLADG